MNVRVVVSVIAVASLAAAVPAQAQERPRARAVEGVDGVVDTFKRFPVVALGEDHGNVAQHAFLRKLVSDARFARAVDDIVIEAGSASHQRVVDRFIAGRRVSRSALIASWRDAIGGGSIGTWDSPIYERFLRTIRRSNRGRPPRDRLRVLLGDPAVDWGRMRTAQDMQRFGDRRDSHYASVVDREVLRKGRRALLIGGVFHFDRDPDAPVANAMTLIDRQHPGKAYYVTLAPREHLASFPANSLVPIDGTDLGGLRPRRPPHAPPARTYEEYADAWFVPDPAKEGWFSSAYPTAFPDAWWKEMSRRNRLLYTKFEPAEWFGVRCSYGSIQGRGVPEAVRIGAAAGEPRPSGPAASGATPQATGAAAAIVGQLAGRKVVAIGDAPALDEQHAFLRELIQSGQLLGRPVIVVGFGNSRHQRLVDAYVSGSRVQPGALARAWQDTSQLLAYDSPSYEQFFKTVRDANSKLPAGRRIRVLLGEPPLDWSSVDSARDVRKVAARRAAFMARLVKRHGIAQRRSVIVLADRPLVARVPGSITDRLPRDKTWVLEPYVGFGGRQGGLERQLGEPAAPAALTIRGSWLQELSSGANLSPSRPRQPLSRTADALLVLGKAAVLTTLGPLATRFRDPYVEAIKRRHRLLFGTRFDPARAFPTSQCFTPTENVGGGPGGDGPPPAGGQGAPRPSG